MRTVPGLIASAAVAAAWEAWALRTGAETLTEGLRRLWRHPEGRFALVAGLALVVAHVAEGGWRTWTSER